jgi:hypothetical protein
MKFKEAKAKIEQSHISRVHVTTFSREDFNEELSTSMGFGYQDLKEKPKKLFNKLICEGYDVEIIPNMDEDGFSTDIYVEKGIQRIYLAIPYTGLEDKAFKIANDVALDLMGQGHVVFSPITHSHSLSPLMDDEYNNWDFWRLQDLPFIDWCDKVVIINVGENGEELIENSVGVQAEIEYAESIGKTVE